MIIFRILLLYFCILFSVNSFANFGNTCSMVSSMYVSKELLENLENNTIYGFVKNLIDIQNCGENYTESCSIKDPNTIFTCVKKTHDISPTVTSENSNRFRLELSQSYRLGDLTNHPKVIADQNISDIEIYVGMLDGKICLAMPTINGYAPIACKDLPASSTSSIPQASDLCSSVSSSCNLSSASDSNSRIKNGFFGKVVQCVHESLDIVFFDPKSCPDSQNFSNQETKIKPFVEFYNYMKTIVIAVITLYIISYGIKIALNPGEFSHQDAFIVILKILLVIYFSIGFNSKNWFSGKEKNNNGITEIVLPFMLDFSTSMSTHFVNNSSTNNLCSLSPDDYTNPKYKYYSLWDSLDCRMNTYLGINKIFFSGSERNNFALADSKTPPGATRPNTNTGEFGNRNTLEAIPSFTLLIAIMLGGGFIPFIILIFIILVTVGMVFSILMSFLVSVLLMYILAYVAPIFVPMSLFERTKSYFDSWLSLCMGTSLQTVIILAFSAFVFNLLDSILFEGCYFLKHFDLLNKVNFELMILEGQNGQNCQESLGYKMYKYYQYSNGWRERTFLFFKITSLNDIYGIESQGWKAVVTCYFLKTLLERIYDFSQNLSNGMNLGGYVSSPTAVIDKVNSAAQNLLSKGPSALMAYSKINKEANEHKDGKDKSSEEGKA